MAGFDIDVLLTLTMNYVSFNQIENTEDQDGKCWTVLDTILPILVVKIHEYDRKQNVKERHDQLCKICVSAQKLYDRTYLVCALIIIAYEDISFF